MTEVNHSPVLTLRARRFKKFVNCRHFCAIYKLKYRGFLIVTFGEFLPKDKPHKSIQKTRKHWAKKTYVDNLDKENEEKVGIETKKAIEIEKQGKKDEQLEQQAERDGDY